MALIVNNTNTQLPSELVVLIARKKGNAFQVNPIKGREGAYRVLGNVQSGSIAVPIRDGSVANVDAAGLSVNVVITEDDAMAIRELGLNAYVLKGSFSARIQDGEEYEGTVLEGSVWAEPIGDINLEPSQAAAVSADSVTKAAANAKARHAEYLALAGATDGVKSSAPTMA